MHHEDGEDLDVVECEEFVDQCKAYATELAEDQKRCVHGLFARNISIPIAWTANVALAVCGN